MTAEACFHLRIKVMADYETSGLWCEDCGMLRPDDLGLPADLAQRLSAWIATYDSHIDDWLKRHARTSTPPDFAQPPLALPEAVDAFNREGFALAREVKDLLRGSGRAVYYWIE